MALELSFVTSMTVDGKVMTFQETTGEYNAVSNTTGWGAPNPLVGDATVATVEIIKPGDTTVYSINILASFPSNDTSTAWGITMADLGGTADDVFPDGVYDITYKVTALAVDYQVSRYNFAYANVKCCVQKMFANLTISGCSGCDTTAADKAITAYAYFKALLSASVCGELEEAASLLAYINKLCSGSTDCTNCN